MGRVVERSNCSGCGACAVLFEQVKMHEDDDGFARPKVVSDRTLTRRERKNFARVCPGASLIAPSAVGAEHHAIFGRHLGAWEAWAADEEVRFNGSSGGVLTALSMLRAREGGRVIAVKGGGPAEAASPSPEPVILSTAEDLLATAGSRYAPVATAAALPTESPLTNSDTFVGKPCEVSAVSRMSASENAQSALRLSFFCAGTPSKHATDQLIDELGFEPKDVESLRYRGSGWPGQFTVETHDGAVAGTSYADSWGRVLGKDLQWRCKICPDGTGEFADISVGDFWEADETGYPKFAEGSGRSVVICRTERGRAFFQKALDLGVLQGAPVSLDEAAAVQPLQSDRRLTLAGRLIGARLGGRTPPRVRGFGALSSFCRYPSRNLRAIVGTLLRARGRRR